MFQTVAAYVILIAIAVFIFNLFYGACNDMVQWVRDKSKEDKLKKVSRDYIKQKKYEEKSLIPEKYFGLFEFIFENCNDEEDLKKEYCSIIKEKMDLKHKNSKLKINATDKVFFNGTDFSKLEVIVDDFVKLYSFFVNINQKRHIKTGLRFSIWSKPGVTSLQQAFKVLSELNSLNFKNQVIVNDIIYQECKKQYLEIFEFLPNGIIKLTETDEDFDLYRLIKIPSKND